MRAQILTARGESGAAIEALTQLLDTAPPGFAGWTIPVEPLLRQLHDVKGFDAVLQRLSERAR